MMRKSKRERLEAKGWRLGTAQEFLGLSNEESAYVELRLRLADSLRLRRQKRNLSQTALARMVHSSQSRVAKMEGGDPSVSLDLLIRAHASADASRRCGSLPLQSKRLDQGGQRGRLLSSARVIEEVAWERRAPALEHPHQPASGDEGHGVVLQRPDDTDAVESRPHLDLGIVDDQRSVHRHAERVPPLLELPSVHAARALTKVDARVVQQIARVLGSGMGGKVLR